MRTKLVVKFAQNIAKPEAAVLCNFIKIRTTCYLHCSKLRERGKGGKRWEGKEGGREGWREGKGGREGGREGGKEGREERKGGRKGREGGKDGRTERRS